MFIFCDFLHLLFYDDERPLNTKVLTSIENLCEYCHFWNTFEIKLVLSNHSEVLKCVAKTTMDLIIM